MRLRKKSQITISRYARGWLVRLGLKRQRAAICIQSHGAGFLVRKQIRSLAARVVQLQKALRGHHARQAVGTKRADYEEAAKATQRAFRGYKGRRQANKRKDELQFAQQEQKSALAIQKVARGKKDRARSGKMAK